MNKYDLLAYIGGFLLAMQLNILYFQMGGVVKKFIDKRRKK